MVVWVIHECLESLERALGLSHRFLDSIMWLNNQVANWKETAAENKSKKYSDFITFTCSNAYSCKYLIRQTHITLIHLGT